MNTHDPYEHWILKDGPLNEEQASSLNRHLAGCTHCQQVKLGWERAHQQMTGAEMAVPAPGFSQRWQSSLAERRASRQKNQVRRFFKYLIGINLLSFTGLVSTLILGTSPLKLFSGLLQGSVSTFLYAKEAQNLILGAFHSVPLFIPVAFWILISTGFCLAALVWGASMWRYLFKGVGAK